MRYYIEAACGCNMGKVRKNNEDNFYFNKKCLDVENDGMNEVLYFDDTLREGLCFAVFDGMGGENFGEYASFGAAYYLCRAVKPRMSNKKQINDVAMNINKAVVEEKKKMYTEKMGTTMVSLHFKKDSVYICNVGDSRAYRLRNKKLVQLSEDHVENTNSKKSPLTQHLGIDPDEMLIEPYVVKENLQIGDVFLLCSDGVTDMLTDAEIENIMRKYWTVDTCVQMLILEALNRGGKDNITVIVGRIY